MSLRWNLIHHSHLRQHLLHPHQLSPMSYLSLRRVHFGGYHPLHPATRLHCLHHRSHYLSFHLRLLALRHHFQTKLFRFQTHSLQTDPRNHRLPIVNPLHQSHPGPHWHLLVIRFLRFHRRRHFGWPDLHYLIRYWHPDHQLLPLTRLLARPRPLHQHPLLQHRLRQSLLYHRSLQPFRLRCRLPHRRHLQQHPALLRFLPQRPVHPIRLLRQHCLRLIVQHQKGLRRHLHHLLLRRRHLPHYPLRHPLRRRPPRLLLLLLRLPLLLLLRLPQPFRQSQSTHPHFRQHQFVVLHLPLFQRLLLR